MDIGERIAFMVVFLMGATIVSSQFVELPYESVILTVIGSLMLLFCAWGFISDISRKYKVVRA